MSLKFWNKEISFINSAKNAVYRASDYNEFKVEDLKLLLLGLNKLLKIAEEKNIDNVYENEDYLKEKEVVKLNVEKFLEEAKKCKEVESFDDMLKIVTMGEAFTQLR